MKYCIIFISGKGWSIIEVGGDEALILSTYSREIDAFRELDWMRA